MGVKDEDIVHIRRGALLHDMGKMGIPDSILLKPGPLTDDEWEIMRRHPQYAYDMLYPIKYLRPAIDIPFHHHEKWDGTGYPKGLKGAQIPLSARIFAIVDVWDALRSDRPYRAAWPKEKVMEHVQSLSGTHFDPMVVYVFMKVIDTIEESVITYSQG
jgi:HD-GYP domain-containing protein (c-di-GMP phosphodiesterase class II)